MRLLLIAALAAILSQACRREQPALQIQPGPDTVAVARMSAPPAGMAATAFLSLSYPCGKDSLSSFYSDTSGKAAISLYSQWDSARSDHGWFVVRNFEGGMEWEFLSKGDCGRIRFSGKPRPNPGGSRFAAVGNHYGDTALETMIVATGPAGAFVEWHDTLPDAGGWESRWVDDSTLEAEAVPLSGGRLNRVFARRGGKWSVRVDTLARSGDSPAADAAPPYPEAVGESADP